MKQRLLLNGTGTTLDEVERIIPKTTTYNTEDQPQLTGARVTMNRYALAFDLAKKDMEADGLNPSQITTVYQTEIPQALAACGFTKHTQGSIYMTEENIDQLAAIVKLQTTLAAQAPHFLKYARRVHLFEVQAWSDVTGLLTQLAVAAPMGT